MNYLSFLNVKVLGIVSLLLYKIVMQWQDVCCYYVNITLSYALSIISPQCEIKKNRIKNIVKMIFLVLPTFTQLDTLLIYDVQIQDVSKIKVLT